MHIKSFFKEFFFNVDNFYIPITRPSPSKKKKNALRSLPACESLKDLDLSCLCLAEITTGKTKFA